MSRQLPHSDVRIRLYELPDGSVRITLRGMRSGRVVEGTSWSPNLVLVWFAILRLWIKGAKELSANSPKRPDIVGS